MQQARQAATECTAPIVWQVTRCWKALYLRNVQQKKLEQTDKKGNRRMNKITIKYQVDHLILEALRRYLQRRCDNECRDERSGHRRGRIDL